MGSRLRITSRRTTASRTSRARGRLDRRRQYRTQHDDRPLELPVSGERASYEFSLQLYETLARELNFNIMFSQRGVLTLAHSRHDLDAHSRWANAMLCNGIDVELLDRTAGATSSSRG
jgi:glycine/D-amino acid oxidase-like deaminating enzyme